MTELELTRTPHDRRRYALEGIGTVRLTGLFSRDASAEGAGDRWTFSRRGFWRRGIDALDADGAIVGAFVPRDIRRGGTLRWAGREFTLRPVSVLQERYALSEDERDLVLLDGKGWGGRPVRVSLTHPDTVEPGLLLFAAFVVHVLAVDASGSAGGSTAAVSGSYGG